MAVQNSLARQDQSMKLSVYLQNDAVKKQINQVVGGKNGTRFISSIVSAVQSTPALIFKWNEEQIKLNDVLKEFGKKPLLGDQRGKTRWIVFMK